MTTPDRIWFNAWDRLPRMSDDGSSVEYIRADVSAARIADLERQLAEAHLLSESDAELMQEQNEIILHWRRQLAKARDALAVSAGRLTWCAGILPSDNPRGLVSAWAEEARILSSMKGTP